MGITEELITVIQNNPNEQIDWLRIVEASLMNNNHDELDEIMSDDTDLTEIARRAVIRGDLLTIRRIANINNDCHVDWEDLIAPAFNNIEILNFILDYADIEYDEKNRLKQISISLNQSH